MNRLVALAGTVSLTACAHVGATGDRALASGARYVALGSSFAAGAGIGATQPGTPDRCGRTVNNYASLLAARLEFALDDESCNGATTEHVLGAWKELPPQIDAVTPDTKLVTVTVGGNDLNYIGNLFAASCAARDGLEFQGQTIPCQSAKPPTPGDYSRAEANLRRVADAVRTRAPQAKVVFIQYATLVPETLCADVPLTEAQAALARTTATRLAEITARVVSETGAALLPANEISRSHTPCDAQPWANGFPEGADVSKGAPWHPNAAGHAAIADALAAMLKG